MCCHVNREKQVEVLVTCARECFPSCEPDVQFVWWWWSLLRWNSFKVVRDSEDSEWLAWLYPSDNYFRSAHRRGLDLERHWDLWTRVQWTLGRMDVCVPIMNSSRLLMKAYSGFKKCYSAFSPTGGSLTVRETPWHTALTNPITVVLPHFQYAFQDKHTHTHTLTHSLTHKKPLLVNNMWNVSQGWSDLNWQWANRWHLLKNVSVFLYIETTSIISHCSTGGQVC